MGLGIRLGGTVNWKSKAFLLFLFFSLHSKLMLHVTKYNHDIIEFPHKSVTYNPGYI
jgi:hypothetical protein